eukprot:711999-Amorphochlora_amoeboformis.AAC.1
MEFNNIPRCTSCLPEPAFHSQPRYIRKYSRQSTDPSFKPTSPTTFLYAPSPLSVSSPSQKIRKIEFLAKISPRTRHLISRRRLGSPQRAVDRTAMRDDVRRARPPESRCWSEYSKI